jgi:hypothetical protein
MIFSTDKDGVLVSCVVSVQLSQLISRCVVTVRRENRTKVAGRVIHTPKLGCINPSAATTFTVEVQPQSQDA